MTTLNASGKCIACNTEGATRWCGWAWPQGWAGKAVGQWACVDIDACCSRILQRVMAAQRAEVTV